MNEAKITREADQMIAWSEAAYYAGQPNPYRREDCRSWDWKRFWRRVLGWIGGAL